VKLCLLEFVTDRFSVESRKAKPKKAITAKYKKHKVLNEIVSELQSKTYKIRQARENACDKDTAGFGSTLGDSGVVF